MVRALPCLEEKFSESDFSCPNLNCVRPDMPFQVSYSLYTFCFKQAIVGEVRSSPEALSLALFCVSHRVQGLPGASCWVVTVQRLAYRGAFILHIRLLILHICSVIPSRSSVLHNLPAMLSKYSIVLRKCSAVQGPWLTASLQECQFLLLAASLSKISNGLEYISYSPRQDFSSTLHNMLNLIIAM